MTDEDDEHIVAPFSIEQIKDNDKNDKIFILDFLLFNFLWFVISFLGFAVSNLSYEDHAKLAKGKSHKLSALNEFFLMPCWLRLGLFEQDLAQRFQITQSSVSRISSTWINFCYCKFKELPIWPFRDVVDSNMPLYI